MGKYYLIGIKGSGMSSLAVILNDLGHQVIGYDDDSKPKYTEELLKLKNIPIHYNNEYQLTDEIVIYSPAFKLDHPELKRSQELGLNILIYNKMLGELTKIFSTTAICGCHGKTTTTALLAQTINHLSDFPKTNYLIGDGTGYANPDNKNLVIEACEYQRHFLDYYPENTIITNIELDHVDYYHDLDDIVSAYQSFVNQTKDLVIACGDDENIRKLSFKQKVIFYGFNDNNNVIAKNINLTETGSTFDCYINNEFIHSFELKIFGKHMILNALAVISLLIEKNVNPDEIATAINLFQGAKRRFTVHNFDKIITINDYAHHHTEIKVTIESARQKYPDKEIVSIYLPNTYSRTKDFFHEEASALNLADKVYIMDIKADRESQIDYPDISSDLILNELNNGEKISLNEVEKLLIHKNSVMIFMSCTSIYQILEKYEDLLKNKSN